MIERASRPSDSAVVKDAHLQASLQSLAPAKKAPLQTLSRGLRILRFVAGSPDLVRLRDVARALSLDRSIALRLLQTLEAEGFLRKDPVLKAYATGPALNNLGKPASLLERLTQSAKPFLEELTAVTGLTSHVGMLEDGHVSLVEVRMAAGPVAVQQMPGEFEEVYCSAIGKALHAFLPEAERLSLANAMTFKPHKSRTLPDIAALEQECTTIRLNGVAFDRDEGPSPLACIAAPVLDASGAPLASIGVSGIAALVPGSIDQQLVWIEAVKLAASRLGRALS
jgi:DNA-binding IclR family transcriptional regulator